MTTNITREVKRFKDLTSAEKSAKKADDEKKSFNDLYLELEKKYGSKIAAELISNAILLKDKRKSVIHFPSQAVAFLIWELRKRASEYFVSFEEALENYSINFYEKSYTDKIMVSKIIGGVECGQYVYNNRKANCILGLDGIDKISSSDFYVDALECIDFRNKIDVVFSKLPSKAYKTISEFLLSPTCAKPNTDLYKRVWSVCNYYFKDSISVVGLWEGYQALI